VTRLKANNMMTAEKFMELVLSFPATTQKPHFERTGLSVIGKKMFANYLARNNTANIFLTPEEQAVFCKMDTDNIYPVPNKWGEKGATTFELDTVPVELIWEALLSAYNDVLNQRSKLVKALKY
jgi:predicted DNA-binding protein (MmcQ/YjbR family)